MNRDRKEFIGDVALVAASIVLTLIVILSSGTVLANHASHWTGSQLIEGER